MNRSRNLSILAIDDNIADLELLRIHLDEITDYEITLHTFLVPEKGRVWLENHTADIILLDYFLGTLTGLDLFGIFRKAGIMTPVILLTGCGGEEMAVEAMKAGVSDYLPKGTVSPNSLTRAFANAIEKQRLRERIEDHRRKLEETVLDLQRKNGEIKSFYHTLSHELRTPLTSVREFVSIVNEGIAGPVNPDQQQYLLIAQNSCDQMSQLIADLLDATRLDTSKLALARNPQPIGPIVDHVVASLSSGAMEKKIELTGNVAVELPLVNVDEQRIIQVLTNLVTNALKFTPEEGVVTIAAEASKERDRFVTVSVSDTGCGIPEEDLELIFDRLYQVQKVENGSSGGLGLGLYLAKELVHLHGGRIGVESRLGAGSTLSFEVPAGIETETDSDRDSVNTQQRQTV